MRVNKIYCGVRGFVRAFFFMFVRAFFFMEDSSVDLKELHAIVPRTSHVVPGVWCNALSNNA